MSAPHTGPAGSQPPKSRVPRVTMLARAKVNLCLSVSPPLPPESRDAQGRPRGGWHRICSWFATIDLADEIELTRLEGEITPTFHIEWAPDAPRPSPIDWPVEKDLGARALALLQQHTGQRLPVSVRVRKRVPVGGGLGGGSADAAAMLQGINRMFELGLPSHSLVELSKSLGSDVAYFLDEDREVPRPAIVSGFGDEIRRVDAPVRGLGIVLLVPGFGCPTGAVYGAYDRQPLALRDGAVDEIVHAAAVSGGAGPLDSTRLFNDLEAPACAIAPELGALMKHIRSRSDLPPLHLTGSGSTLFMLSAEPKALAERIAEWLPGVTAVATRTV